MTITDIPESHPDYQRIIAALNGGECPDCEVHAIVPGPRGGASRNVWCSSCGARFNVGPWREGHVHHFFFVQRLG
jgi:hypothetical protein